MIDKMNIGRDSTRKIAGSAQKFADKFVTSEDFQRSGAYSGPIVISKGINYSIFFFCNIFEIKTVNRR